MSRRERLVNRRPIRSVRAVVVDYNGGDLTRRCIGSLVETEWAGEVEIIVVDNASDDPVAEDVRVRWPHVTTVTAGRNLGFAGGANLGIRQPGTFDAVALINNDAVVDSGWLNPLVQALDGDSGVGAACPKIQFEGQFAPVRIETEVHRRGWLDRRAIGVEVRGVHVRGGHSRAVDAQVQFVEGFSGLAFDSRSGEPFYWTGRDALLHLPVTCTSEEIEIGRIELRSDRPKRVAVSSGPEQVELIVRDAGAVVQIGLAATPITVVNNVGTLVRPDWYGVDRGFQEPDDGRYDRSEDVPAWCGGAVLLRGDYLDTCGLFDERLFLYYEDLELAIRGSKAGWRYRYIPTSVVRHRHAATAVTGSASAEYYKERNRLLVATRHAPLGELIKVVVRYVLSTVSYARRDVVSSLVRGRRPDTTIVRRRLRSFAGWLRLLPSMLATRRRAADTSRGNT